jgi:MFS family permease
VEQPGQRGVLVVLSLSMLLSSLGISIANVALPALVQALGASFQSVQWVVLAYLLAITSSIVGAGRLGDLYGRRALLMGGLGLFTAGSLSSGLAPALWLVIAARAVQGLGAAVMMALTLALVSEVVPRERTGSAMGLLGTTSALGTALGPSVGGVLLALLGWRAVFLVHVPLGLLALALAYRFLPADREGSTGHRVGFDKGGTLLLALTLAAWSLAMTTGRGSFGALNAGLLGVAALGAGLFVLVENRTASPLVQLAMFRDPRLSAGLAMNLLVSTVLMTTLVVGPFYLSLALGLGAGAVGLVMSAGPLVSALTGAPAGRLVDRLGTPPTTVAGLLGIAVGSLLLAVTPEALHVGGYLVPLVVLTSGYALFQAANNTAVMGRIGPTERGVVSAMLSLSRNLGLVTGASVMGAVFVSTSGPSPEAVAAGMRATFAVAAGLVGVALVIGLGSRALTAWIPALLLLCTSSASAEEGPRLLGLMQVQHVHAPEGDAVLVNRARLGVLGTAHKEDLRYTFVTEFGRERSSCCFWTWTTHSSQAGSRSAWDSSSARSRGRSWRPRAGCRPSIARCRSAPLATRWTSA